MDKIVPVKTSQQTAWKISNNILVVDEKIRKVFQEKREARQAQIKAKIQDQRKKHTIDASKGAIPKNARPLMNKKEVKNDKMPQIKPTKASQLRLEKNNPFHGYDLEDIKKMVETAEMASISFQPVKKNTQLDNRKTLSDRKAPKPASNSQVKQFPRLGLLSKPKVLDTKSKKEESNSKKLTDKKFKPPLRRSISSSHIQKLGVEQANRCVHKSGMLKAHSADSVSFMARFNIPSPITEESEPGVSRLSNTGRKAVMFTSPLRRRSRSFSSNDFQTPLPSELREQLINWLKKRGKSLNAYRHLRCFGVHQSTPYRPARARVSVSYDDVDDEDKENNAQYASMISPDNDIPKIIDYTNRTTNEDLFGTPNLKAERRDMNQLARDALSDLHALILDKYPQEQCINWLAALKKKYPNLQEQPQYWECRAALGEINGEFNEAVECYQKAIIKGAEVSKIDYCIEKLLEKFSVLDLDASTRKQNTVAKKQRSKVILDARNVFKSSVIKFAVSQRETRSKLKDQAEALTPLVAKPVRRSTRKSVSCYSTPKDSVYNSLREIETSLQQSVGFEKNPALNS